MAWAERQRSPSHCPEHPWGGAKGRRAGSSVLHCACANYLSSGVCSSYSCADCWSFSWDVGRGVFEGGCEVEGEASGELVEAGGG